MVPGTGMIPNNYMYVFNPQAGLANSVAPGKRVTSSMSPLIILKDGKPRFALGLPGGLRIFPSALQATLNLIDHRMSLQEAVEAPRVWTQGYELELEPGASDSLAQELTARGHRVCECPTLVEACVRSNSWMTARCRVQPAGERTAHRSGSVAARHARACGFCRRRGVRASGEGIVDIVTKAD